MADLVRAVRGRGVSSLRDRAIPKSLAEKKILVVGINFAPEPTGIAPYTTAMTEFLAARARSVTVLTGIPHYPHWRVLPGYRWTFRASEPVCSDNQQRLNVRRLRHYVPARQNALTRAAYEFSFMAQAWSTPVKHAPDLIIAVTPSLGAAVVAARLAQRHGSRLLVVVQDLMAKAAGQSGITGGGKVQSATAALERYALRRADHVAIVSEAFRGQLIDYGVADERIQLLPNWTHIVPVDMSKVEARRQLGWHANPFTVVHTGNIGLKQDLGNLVLTARLMQAERDVRFVIVGDGSQRRAIQAEAADLSNIDFVDPLDDEQYPKSLAAADVLVVNERPGVGDMSLPSKLTSYLAMGRGILAAVSADGATAQELDRTKGAAQLVAPGSPVEMARALRELRSDLVRLDRMGQAGRSYASADLSRESAERRLEQLLDRCLA